MNCLLGETKSISSNNNNNTQASSSNNNKFNSTSCSNNTLSISQNIGPTISSQETCLICGDVASGKHYGLRSCEACKAFFKRTVQGKIEYSCPATRECEINKRRRKACQACRFQKCLNMGMLKEGVRLDRVRGGRQKYRRGLSPGLGGGGGGGGGNGGVSGSGGDNHALGMVGNSPCIFGTSGNSALVNSNVNNLQNNTNNSTFISVGSSNLGTSETNRIMTALINCEPEELTASPAQFVTTIPSTLNVQAKTLHILSDLFDRELVSLIGWAKQIPGFSETITLNDQMRLLQSTWAEVIALSIGYRSHLKRIVNNNNKTGHQQHGNCTHFLSNTPSPTSSSPASTASGYTNSNHTNTININNSNTQNHNHIHAGSVYNSLENTEIRLVFAKDLIIDFKHAMACGVEEIFYNCVQLIKRLDYLKITPREYIILKAICLTNADVRLENPKATHQLRDIIMDTLYEATILDSTDDPTITNNTTSSSSTTTTSSNIFGKDNNGNNITLTVNHQLKMDAQELPLSSMNQYAASTSPPRPSSSVPSSSSISSVSSHNNINSSSSNNNNNNINVNLDSSNTNGNKKLIVNHRLNQVLLCLPVLRQIDSCIRKFWNDVRKGPNNVPMNKLFEEMLEPCQRNYKSCAEM